VHPLIARFTARRGSAWWPPTGAVRAALAIAMTAGSSVALAQSRGPCDWTLTASSPAAVVSQGSQAIYLQGDGGVMFLFSTTGTGFVATGTLMVSEFNGLGTYAVGMPANADRQGSGASFMIQLPAGGWLALGAGDGSDVLDQGKTIGTLPSPSRLTITWQKAGEIRGDLSGTFYDLMAIGSTPRRVVLVPVHLVFTAKPVCR
jgi:hypothetical protein